MFIFDTTDFERIQSTLDYFSRNQIATKRHNGRQGPRGSIARFAQSWHNNKLLGYLALQYGKP